jgi:hypothetical protein
VIAITSLVLRRRRMKNQLSAFSYQLMAPEADG